MVDSTVNPKSLVTLAVSVLAVLVANAVAAADVAFQVEVDRGTDLGQIFGSLFEATSEDGSLVVGAGFQNSMSISQDGKKLAETAVTGPLAERLQAISQLKPVRWGEESTADLLVPSWTEC